MPKVSMDYSKTVIYHFVCEDTSIKCSYVGSTTNFIKRKHSHKHIYNNENHRHRHLKIYQTIQNHGGWNNWKMVPLEEYPCENYNQQIIREQYWIDQLKPELNDRSAYTEPEVRKEIHNNYTIEWRKNNKDKVKEQRKKYREEHKEELREYQKAYNAKRSQASQSIHIDPSAMPVLDCQGQAEESH